MYLRKGYVKEDCPVEVEGNMKLAHAYVPFQTLGDIFNPREALCKGTLFPELWMPYIIN